MSEYCLYHARQKWRAFSFGGVIMRKLSKACSVLSAIAVCLLFAAGNVLTVLVCGGVALIMAFIAHLLKGAL